MLVITLSLILIANYNYAELDPKTSDIFFLTIVLYFFVFLNTIIILLQKYFKEQEKKRELEVEKNTQKKGHLIVRSERKNTIILFDSIEYIESLGNYIKIFTSLDKIIVSKEKISSLSEQLPDYFLRIHRSYIINRNKIESYTKDWITIDENRLPLSRKYKEGVLQQLSLQGKSRILASGQISNLA
jgi:DNA-binding LytR/AlgR family response regulator